MLDPWLPLTPVASRCPSSSSSPHAPAPSPAPVARLHRKWRRRYERISSTTASTSSSSSTSSTTSSSGTTSGPPADGAWSVALMSNTGACHTLSDTDTVGEVTTSRSSPPSRTASAGRGELHRVPGEPDGLHRRRHRDARPAHAHDPHPAIAATATQASPAAGSVTFASPQTNLVDYTSSACSFYFLPGTPEAVAPGKIWVAFDCTAVSGGGSTCEIAQSVALFEDCST